MDVTERLDRLEKQYESQVRLLEEVHNALLGDMRGRIGILQRLSEQATELTALRTSLNTVMHEVARVQAQVNSLDKEHWAFKAKLIGLAGLVGGTVGAGGVQLMRWLVP